MASTSRPTRGEFVLPHPIQLDDLKRCYTICSVCGEGVDLEESEFCPPVPPGWDRNVERAPPWPGLYEFERKNLIVCGREDCNQYSDDEDNDEDDENNEEKEDKDKDEDGKTTNEDDQNKATEETMLQCAICHQEKPETEYVPARWALAHKEPPSDVRPGCKTPTP